MQSSFSCEKIDDFNDSEEIYKKPKKQSNYQNSVNSGKWIYDEVLKYIIFIDKNRLSLASRSKRRISKVFKEMANFIETRNAIQCRSHHQKQLQKFRNTSKIINFFKNQFGQTSYNLKVTQFLPNQVKSSDNQNHLLSKDLQNKNQEKKSVETQTDMAGIDKIITFGQNHLHSNTVSNFQHYPQQFFSYFPSFNWHPTLFHGL